MGKEERDGQTKHPEKKGLTYAEAGVSLDAGDDFTGRIARLVKETPQTGVISSIGGFSGLFSLDPDQYRSPVLVSSTDGVGTKLKIAFALNIHNTVGTDLVAMGVNDILVPGARPLFFLDYFATAKLDPDRHEAVIRGIVDGCKQAECALIGGETAELPGMYAPGEYDLAGFAVGIVERERIIDGSSIRPGDVVVGIPSSGLHSNGFSLARKVLLEQLGYSLKQYLPDLQCDLGEELLRPTRIYTRLVREALEHCTVKGIAHVTGGGIPGNFSRILPDGVKAVIRRNSWEIPPIFHLIQHGGNIRPEEMDRVFNMGIGLIVVMTDFEFKRLEEVLNSLAETGFRIGEIAERKDGEPTVLFT